MPKFAAFDPSAGAPTPVAGWYDTDKHAYKKLPPESHLLKLSEDEWSARLSTPFVANGKLAAAPAASDAQLQEEAFARLQRQANKALADSADVALQALETGRPVPEVWVKHRAALRAIAKGADTSATALPTAPEA